MEADKIIITTEDVQTSVVPQVSQSLAPSGFSLWWRLLSLPLVLCPPLLLIVTVADLLIVRRRVLSVRYAHTFHYCCLLLVSGVLWTLLLFTLALWAPSNLLDQVAETAVAVDTFPPLPATNALTGRDVAHQLSPLVVVVHRAKHSLFPSDGIAKKPCGTGVLTFAMHQGCLLLTSRHVVEALSRGDGLGRLVGITFQNGQEAHAKVIGLHRTLDLAILWVTRDRARLEYVQPLRDFRTIEVGEQVFVIGHPEGLEFSISGGLVAQTRGADLIQISAPVSPGNSGGPVYDIHGRLIAVVQSLVDKIKSPNAENLNFAVRADALLDAGSWTLAEEGRTAIAALNTVVNQTRCDSNVLETTRQ